ncbi:MAG: biopolymer transporter ExbD, partial [Planctomycetota bacterium]
MDFQRSRRRRTGLELTPLIDVVFLLLVFLILTANFQMPSMSLDLPGGTTEDESEEQVVIVEI